MDSARAFWIEEPGRGAIRAEPLPTPAPGEALVKACFSGISRGTESLIFRGAVPASEFARMRAPFQAGSFPAPVKYGYASVGMVQAGPDDLVGRHVFALHPHQTAYVVPASAVTVVPAGVPPRRAVLAANAETAVNGLWDAGVQAGDRVAVIGAGTVGCLVAWLAGRMPGCRVELIDTNPHRAVVAQALGVTFAQSEEATPDADVVIHASGSPAGLAAAMRLAAFEARIVEMSWYGTRDVSLPLGEAFHARRLSIVSSQVGSVAASQRARWDHRRRMQLALGLLADAALDALLNEESEFDDLPSTMARLAASPGDTLCHVVRY